MGISRICFCNSSHPLCRAVLTHTNFKKDHRKTMLQNLIQFGLVVTEEN